MGWKLYTPAKATVYGICHSISCATDSHHMAMLQVGQMGIMLHLRCECYNAFGVIFVKNLATVIGNLGPLIFLSFSSDSRMLAFSVANLMFVCFGCSSLVQK